MPIFYVNMIMSTDSTNLTVDRLRFARMHISWARKFLRALNIDFATIPAKLLRAGKYYLPALYFCTT